MAGRLSDQPAGHSSPCPAWHLHRSNCYEGHFTENKWKGFQWRKFGVITFTSFSYCCIMLPWMTSAIHSVQYNVASAAPRHPLAILHEWGDLDMGRKSFVKKLEDTLWGVCTLTRRSVSSVDQALYSVTIPSTKRREIWSCTAKILHLTKSYNPCSAKMCYWFDYYSC